MAIITNRATLLTAIADYLARDDLTTFTPNFLQNAEGKIYRRLNLRNEETELNVPIGGGVAPLPYRFKGLKCAYVDRSPIALLDYVPPESIYREHPDRSATTVPRQIAREGDHFIFGPEATDGTLKGIYYQKPRPLVATADTDADEIVEDGTASETHFISQAVTLTNAVYTLSVYARQGTGTDRSISLQASSASVTARADFNLEDGSVAHTVGAQTETAFIEDVGNDWYRCAISFDAEAESTTVGIYLATNESAYLLGDDDLKYSGNTTSGAYVWGVQLEVSPYPTEYIQSSSTPDTGYKNRILAGEALDGASWTATRSSVSADAIAQPIEVKGPTQNWYTNNAPEVLLYGSLLEAEPFIMNDERLPIWKSLFDDAVASLLEEEASTAYSRGNLRVQPEARRWG